MSTAPESGEPPGGSRGARARRGPVVTARRWWRQLTSMRTALVLLFLLAVAAVPGSAFPQRNVNQSGVSDFFTRYPKAAPILDRLWAFDVYASPWFGAIYLLLFISLVGCLTPRMRKHVQAMLRKPPDAPRRLGKLPQHSGPHQLESTPQEAGEKIAKLLRKRRWRAAVRVHPPTPAAGAGAASGETVTVSAEKGFLRETGNLLFHFSLLAILIGVALGSAYGWHGNRLLVAGPDQAFCSSLQQYDDYALGSWAEPSDLPPLCLELVDFEAAYQKNGQPTHYAADTRHSIGAAPAQDSRLEVNDPLRLDGGSVYLVGHGYAPVIRYTDRYGNTQTSVSPFLQMDGMGTGEGVAAFPDANINPKTGKRDPKAQMGFQGVYMPTLPDQPKSGHSAFPAERDPGLVLFAYRGDLGLDAGIPRSVYSLDQRQIDTDRLKMIGNQPKLLRPGDSWTLDDGSKVEFTGTREWITLQVRDDPGAPLVLVAAGALLLGLLGSLTVRRRRVWFRLVPADAAEGSGRPGSGDPSRRRTIVEAGGLSRSDHTGFGDEFAKLVSRAAPERGLDPAAPSRSAPGAAPEAAPRPREEQGE
ncbi:MAG: cytochrome c biogenesis protein ResB [Micromonosporaceae bacterium]